MESPDIERLEVLTESQIKETYAYNVFCELKARGVDSTTAFALAIKDEKIKTGLKDGQLKQIRSYVFESSHSNALLSDTEVSELVRERQTISYPSSFSFLNAHNGLRKGCLHTLLGEAGRGKSTLMRSIVLDAATITKVLVILSEESVRDFKFQIGQYAETYFKNKIKARNALLNICLISELDHNFHYEYGFKQWLNLVQTIINREQIGALFYDNFSTGIFSDNFSVQKEVLNNLKQIAIRVDSPVFLLTHPVKNALKQVSFLTSDLIRGNASIRNLSEYIYCLNTKVISNEINSYVLIDKSRHFPKANNRWFKLDFRLNQYDLGYFNGDLSLNENPFQRSTIKRIH